MSFFFLRTKKLFKFYHVHVDLERFRRLKSVFFFFSGTAQCYRSVHVRIRTRFILRLSLNPSTVPNANERRRICRRPVKVKSRDRTSSVFYRPRGRVSRLAHCAQSRSTVVGGRGEGGKTRDGCGGGGVPAMKRSLQSYEEESL